MNDIDEQAKLAVIGAACGIKSLPEIDLYRRLERLFLDGVSAGRHVSPLFSVDAEDLAATPPDAVARAELAQAITTLGRLLPYGVQVQFYRLGEATGDMRVAVETTYQDGEQTRHWFTDVVKH